uniref:centrosomal protein of 63 kDa isoform X3 n=1 Tax=Pristiophorus japonicus TaxID=55135 RepID=UPI00398E422C
MEALLEAVQNLSQDGCSSVLSTCEAELQELMKQIDIMIAQKKSEWEAQFRSVETRLKVREQELSAIRILLDQKHVEIEKLKKSYEKLQRRQLKEVRENVKNRQDKEDGSEVHRLNRKVEEFQAKSLDWEKQRLHYQQQVALLDTERMLLLEQFKTVQQQTVKYQTQLSGRKQLVEQTELISQSEMQHLRSQLERANDTICANDMTMERLKMTADELKDANQRFKKGQHLLQEELQRLQQLIQESREENEELHSKLKAQEDIIQSKDLQQKQLCNELARCDELLQDRVKTVRSLEESLLKQQCSDVSHGLAELQRAQVRLQASLKGEENLQEEVMHLQRSLDSSNDRCTFLNEEMVSKQEELRQMEEEHTKCKTDVKKLRDQLNCVEQQRHSELEGMKLEVSHLTTELHQRDVTIAAMSASTSNMERQLRGEVEKTDRKAKEIKVTQIQFETLKLENEHLAEMLKADGHNCSINDLRDGYFSSLRQLEQENKQLQQDLSEVRTKLEMSAKVSQDRYEMLLLQIQKKLTDNREMEDRRVEELQLEHKEELRELQNRLREMAVHRKGRKRTSQSQQLLAWSDFPNLTEDRGQVTDSDFCNARQSDSCDASPSESLRGITSCIIMSADENETDFSDSTSVHSVHSLHSERFLPLSPAISSPNTSVAVKFLEEEDMRSQQLLKRLDMHIEELKTESERTVDEYV